MDGQTVSAVTEFLVDILIGCFSIATITWVFVGVQDFINDRKREKRDVEYHERRMQELGK